MDATASQPRSVSPEMHVLTSSRQLDMRGRRPLKRKRSDHQVPDPSAGVARFSRPRTSVKTGNGDTLRLPQCSVAGGDSLMGCISHSSRAGTRPEQTALTAAAYNDANMRIPQAFRDPRLHHNGAGVAISSCDDISTGSIPDRASHVLVAPTFLQGSSSMPAVSTHPSGGEDSFTYAATPSRSTTDYGGGADQAEYASIYHQQQEWPEIGLSNTFGSDFHQLPHHLSYTPCHSMPHSMPQSTGMPQSVSHVLPHFGAHPLISSSGDDGPYRKDHSFLVSSHTSLDDALEEPCSVPAVTALHERLASTVSAHPLAGADLLHSTDVHSPIHHPQQHHFLFHTQGPSSEIDATALSSGRDLETHQSVVQCLPRLEESEDQPKPLYGKTPPSSSTDSNPNISMGGGEIPAVYRQMAGHDEFYQVFGHFDHCKHEGQNSCMVELAVSIEASASPYKYSYYACPDGQGQDQTRIRSQSPISARGSSGITRGSVTGLTANIAQEAEAGTTKDPPLSHGPRRRAQMSPSHRQQTAETRKRKACTRCRNQKMRCEIDPSDEMGPCVGCKSFCKTSKKTLHLMPCFRGKITDAVLFRSGGLGLTRRWNGMEMKDVGDRIEPHDVRTIYFTQGLWKTAIEIKVVAFEPLATDVTARFWMLRDSDNDVRKKKELAAYCLFNIQQTADWFERYIQAYAVQAIIEQRTGPVKIAGQRAAFMGVIEKTYMAAVKHYDDLKAKSSELSDDDVHRETRLLHTLFTFWFARRHTTGSAYISGAETLGMKPETKDDTYPLFGKVSLPRMIVAQFDSINHTRLLTRYGKRLLAELEALMMRNQPRWWFAIYVCLFILLREASWLSEDRYRHARQNHGKKLRYSVPSFVQDLQEGCNNLLQHWHYYNCKPWPDPATPWDRHKSLLSELSPEQYDLVMETMADPAVQKQLDIWRRYKSENGRMDNLQSKSIPEGETAYRGSQSQYDWDHPFYWISQLFEDQWRAHPTYQSEL